MDSDYGEFCDRLMAEQGRQQQQQQQQQQIPSKGKEQLPGSRQREEAAQALDEGRQDAQQQQQEQQHQRDSCEDSQHKCLVT